MALSSCSPRRAGPFALFGVAVLNGVVMVNAIDRNLEAGEPMAEAVYGEALSRLRPVLMTAAIAALGLIPMLLASGAGSEVQWPLATIKGESLASCSNPSRSLAPEHKKTPRGYLGDKVRRLNSSHN